MDVGDVYTSGCSSLRCRKPSGELNVILACSLGARLKGLHAHKDFDGILALVPCCDIHTYGMKRPIDVAFISKGGEVVSSIRGLTPNNRRKNFQASVVLERYSCQADWPEVGSRINLGWSPLSKD